MNSNARRYGVRKLNLAWKTNIQNSNPKKQKTENLNWGELAFKVDVAIHYRKAATIIRVRQGRTPPIRISGQEAPASRSPP